MGELSENRAEEHKQQLKREHQKKLQLDDETLMVARDVRVLRQRRKLAEEEGTAAWTEVQRAMEIRQLTEYKLEERNLRKQLGLLAKAQVDEMRLKLQDQVVEATKQRDTLTAQLEARELRRARAQLETEADAEEDLKSMKSLSRKKQAAANEAADAEKTSMVRNLSFGKKDEKSGGGITRVLSFGKSKKKGQSETEGGAQADGEEEVMPASDNSKQKKTSVT